MTPPVPTVVARYVFYNGSKFDADSSDEFAIATDKQVLLPGQTATFQNYSSYSNGLNGIMIDVANLDGSVSASDFNFLVGNSSDVSTWQSAPSPVSIWFSPAAAVAGSTRVELIWNNNAIQNQWLQVTLKADAVTQLTAPDVFYFGNAIGETGNSTTDANVNAGDWLAARASRFRHRGDQQPVGFQSRWRCRCHRCGHCPSKLTAGDAALKLITAPTNGGGAGSEASSLTLGAAVDSADESAASPIVVVAYASSTPRNSDLHASIAVPVSSQPPSNVKIAQIEQQMPAPLAYEELPTLRDLEILRFAENRAWKRLSLWHRGAYPMNELLEI